MHEIYSGLGEIHQFRNTDQYLLVDRNNQLEFSYFKFSALLCNLHNVYTVIGDTYILIHILDRKNKKGKGDTAVTKTQSIVYPVDLIQVKYYGQIR